MKKLWCVAVGFAVIAVSGCSSSKLESEVRAELSDATVASAEEAGISVAGVRCEAREEADMQAELDGKDGETGEEVDDLISESDDEENSIYFDCTVRDKNDSYNAQLCFVHVDSDEKSFCMTIDGTDYLSQSVADFATSEAYKGNGWQVFPSE